MIDSQPIIEANRLTKVYNKNTALFGLDINVHKGEIFGLLGPNGSGKTTTISLFLGLIRPSRGYVNIFDMNVQKHGTIIRANTGYIPGEPGFYEEMTGRSYLNFFSGLKKTNCKKKINQLAERFFQVKLDRKIKAYSRGMKQLVCIIQAFMGDPDLYILDEPTTNLDPLMNQQFYDLILEEQKNGKTIFISSHILAELEKICSRVCILKNGEAAALESVETLREKMKKTIEVCFDGNVKLESLQVEGVESVTYEEGKYILRVSGKINPILSKLSQYPIKTFDYRKMTLEEIFWEYFKKGKNIESGKKDSTTVHN